MDPRRVDPPEMSGKQQLHLSKMRLQDKYEARGKKAGKVSTERVLQESREGYEKKKKSLEGTPSEQVMSSKLSPIHGFCKYDPD